MMAPVLNLLLWGTLASHEVIINMVEPLIYEIDTTVNRNQGLAESTPK